MGTLRFEVSVNGRRVCVAGLDGEGWTEVQIMSDRWPSRFSPDQRAGNPQWGAEDTLRVSGTTDDHDHPRWASEVIRAGDEIVIRVLPAGPADPPAELEHEDPEDG